MNKQKVFIKNQYISELKSDELAIVGALNYLCYDLEFYFNQQMIQDILYDKVSDDKYLVKTLKKAIDSLIDKEILHVIKTSGSGKNTLYFCSNKNIFVDCDNELYTYINIDTFKSTCSVNVDMVKYLFAIASSFNNDTRVGYKTIDNYCIDFNLNKNTFIKFEKIFLEKKILYIVHHEAYLDEFGDFKRPANNYGEWYNKDNVDKTSKKYLDQILACLKDKKTKSLKDGRSISARYNSFVKGTFKGDIKKLKEDVDRYNDFYMKRYEKYHNKEDKNKLKDISVFTNGITEDMSKSLTITHDDNKKDLSTDVLGDDIWGEEIDILWR